MRRLFASAWLALLLLVVGAGPALAQEHIASYDVDITVDANGTLKVVETIDYDFGSAPHHGIYRDIPTTLTYDQRYDRVLPIEVGSVRSATAPDGFVVEDAGGGVTRIRIGDPDQEVTGEHVYEIRYRVEGALNAFDDHLELYWNATGDGWVASIDRATAAVRAPAPIQRVACFAGVSSSTDPCAAAASDGSLATFRAKRLLPYEGMTVVVALPVDAVTRVPRPILRERGTLANEFRVTPVRGVAAGVIAVGLLGWIGVAQWRTGRDRRYRGSPVDQTMGGTADDESVPIGDADTSAPVVATSAPTPRPVKNRIHPNIVVVPVKAVSAIPMEKPA